MLTVQNVTKKVRSGAEEISILKDINMNVKDAEIVSIIGRSGSGKSSLLAVMSGIDSPNSGVVTVDDTDIYALNDDKLTRFRNEHFGIIFQNFNLIPTLTAEENAEVPILLSSGRRKRRGRTDTAKVLELVGMADKRRQRVANLSGGEQQRVAIARALVQEPRILFADEPTGSLDYENSMVVLELFQKIRSELGVSIIVVTHEDYVAKVSDRIIKLSYGVIAE